MHRIGVIGSGYVGLVTGTCLAELGNDVVCADTDAKRIEGLMRGELPLHEPGLAELVHANQASGRLSFTPDVGDAVRGRNIIFIAVGTPARDDGHLDVSHVRDAAIDVAKYVDGPTIVVNKSTVPVQTADLVHSLIAQAKTSAHETTVVSNPEFLREGSAVVDFMHPDRIVIGVSHEGAEAALRELYAPLRAPLLVTDPRTAEMIKLVSNAFLATKISFINEIANICAAVGADVRDVAAGAGADKRIGAACMQPGLGFGGSCLPKDTLALHRIAEQADVGAPLLEAALSVNAAQVRRTVARLIALVGGLRGRTIAVLGLAFKAGTDDTRESPAIAFVRSLVADGAIVVAHDPAAEERAGRELGTTVRFVAHPYDAAEGADALVIATAWNEYTELDLAELRRHMRGDVLLDARNLYDPLKAAAAGFRYAGIGRSSPLSAALASP